VEQALNNVTYVTDALECKRAVKWLCDYISYQCWRPPPAHSKDLHSSIVAAFSCLTTWLTAHPQLLQVDKFLNFHNHFDLQNCIILIEILYMH